MTPLPCLCSSPSHFGQVLVFGLLCSDGLRLVRSLPINRVRSLRGPKPPALPDGFVIHLLGRDCEQFLDECDMLEGLLQAMAQDLYQAFRAAKNPRKGSAMLKAIGEELREIGKFQP